MYKKNAVFITCDSYYVAKAIIGLKCFQSKNLDYDMCIIGKKFKPNDFQLCKKYNVQLFSVDLSNDFINLDKRPYGKQYPLECFYHFYAYKLLNNYDFLVNIEPDIYTNKTLDINFNFVKYIAGVENNVLIRKYSPLMKDYDKIKKNICNNLHIEQPKIWGGFRIYNVKNLSSIRYYEKIIFYYKKSWKINAPRCGDDSLTVLYQMIHPEHVHLFSKKYCMNINILSLENINHYYHFHFGGNIKKYWKNNIKRKGLDNYFCNKMIQFIYNNFNLSFIKHYIPEIYKDITKTKIPFYYYAKDNNFGDLITPYFLKKYCNPNDFMIAGEQYNKKKIISCGSIMRLSDSKTLVYGAGIRDSNQELKGGLIQSVRGPLTRKRLLELNVECPPVYGDPGLLLPLHYNPKINKKYELEIIPHYIHYEKIKNIYKNQKNILIINLINSNIESVINLILSCKKTVSSSLHGLIVSDAYNIPNKWIQFDNNIKGDNTKFYDYFQSVNRKDQTFINNFDLKKLDINTIITQIQQVNVNYDINQLQEHMFFDKNGIKNYSKYLFKNI